MIFLPRTLINSLKRAYVRWMFNKNAIVGSNFYCKWTARCGNESKNRNKITIGNNVSILGKLYSEGEGCISIGDYTTIRGETRIVSVDDINIGNYVIISNHVIIVDNNTHPTNIEYRREMSINGPGTEKWKSMYSNHEPIQIEDSVWIGERAVILKGVHIGYGSIIACDSVVSRDVPKHCIVAGNPAKVVKYLN